MVNIVSDGKDASVDTSSLPFTLDELPDRLDMHKACFDGVTPSLVHWDLWYGNVFVQNGHVSGIIDWERTFWSDELMQDRFRRHTLAHEFLEGFGKTDFTEQEKLRMTWYDLVLYLTTFVEQTVRQYSSENISDWYMPCLISAWEDLTGK